MTMQQALTTIENECLTRLEGIATVFPYYWFSRRSTKTQKHFRSLVVKPVGTRNSNAKRTEKTIPLFSPYNLRLYRQTFFGISLILNPLVIGDHARILPMQERVTGKPVALEICPASTLKAFGLYGPYKGRSKVHRMARQSILNRLPNSRPFAIKNEYVREKAIGDAGGDALDSIIAATAAFHALKAKFVPRDSNKSFYAIEGYVFV